MAKDEPQSYGSDKDWLTGRVGQTVNDQKSEPESHPDFYENRRESEETGEHQGGRISEVQQAENVQSGGSATADEQPISKVTQQSKGARRGGYFKDRDYKS